MNYTYRIRPSYFSVILIRYRLGIEDPIRTQSIIDAKSNLGIDRRHNSKVQHLLLSFLCEQHSNINRRLSRPLSLRVKSFLPHLIH
jgi:hypothetical protein